MTSADRECGPLGTAPGARCDRGQRGTTRSAGPFSASAGMGDAELARRKHLYQVRLKGRLAARGKTEIPEPDPISAVGDRNRGVGTERRLTLPLVGIAIDLVSRAPQAGGAVSVQIALPGHKLIA